jgi:tetratricopeptide (TPR) repeat protein
MLEIRICPTFAWLLTPLARPLSIELFDSCPMSERSDLVFRVRLYHELQRFPDALDSFEALIADSPVLDEAGRTLFFVVYKTAFDSMRQSLRILKSNCEVEADDGHAERVDALVEYQRKSSKELDETCERALRTINDFLLPHAQDPTASAFYYKMRGDIFRYRAECASEGDVRALLEQTKHNYDKSHEICSTVLPLSHPLRLSLIQCNAVFEYEHMHKKEDAAKLVRVALAEMAADDAENFTEDQQAEITATLDVMRKNLGLWDDSGIEK